MATPQRRVDLKPPGSSPLLAQLRKVLALERQLGFGDRAVLGGLDTFLARWAADARESTDPLTTSTLGLSAIPMPYRDMTPDVRAAWVALFLGPESPSPNRRSPPPKVSLSPPPEPSAPSPSRGEGRDRGLLSPGQTLETPLGSIKGFQPDLVERLAKLGVNTTRDLIYFFPHRHVDFSKTRPIASLQVGEDQTAVGTVMASGTVQLGKDARRRGAEVVVGDDSGNIRAIWFNQPWMAGSLKPGMRVALSGRVDEFRGRKSFQNPEYDVGGEQDSAHTGRLVPIYPLTAGLSPRRMRTNVKRILDGAAHLVPEFIPPELVQKRKLLGLTAALRSAHFPPSEEDQSKARLRLAFDELLLIQLGVMGRKKAWKEAMRAHPLHADPAVLQSFFGTLPFTMTGAQLRITQELLDDLAKSTPMSRIIQGEVGSGKTVIALASILVAITNGQQAAFMAPTELLAEQHFRTVRGLLAGFLQPPESADFLSIHLPPYAKPITGALLTGSTSRKRKRELQDMAAQGVIDLLIGTHALFQKDVEFANLGLAIVDEQHRFGVMQRTELRQKGHNPHLLVMTATPIPRSLALTMYGDLDISTLDELPPGRLPIKTRWLDVSRRDTAYRFIQKEVEMGRQAFIVYPLVEESEKLDVAAATEEHQRLSIDVFSGVRLGLLHGRMKQKEKDAVMMAFRGGALDILISTSVVEVGIDIPNATVMMIDWADRFGLAQLHQFRGRVGRGVHQSYCILVSHEPSPTATQRLAVLERVNDGFALAEEDLRLRGAGEFFGTRQSGLPDLRMARLSDAELLEAARTDATALFEQDPTLTRPEHDALRREVERTWASRTLVMGEA